MEIEKIWVLNDKFFVLNPHSSGGLLVSTDRMAYMKRQVNGATGRWELAVQSGDKLTTMNPKDRDEIVVMMQSAFNQVWAGADDFDFDQEVICKFGVIYLNTPFEDVIINTPNLQMMQFDPEYMKDMEDRNVCTFFFAGKDEPLSIHGVSTEGVGTLLHAIATN